MKTYAVFDDEGFPQAFYRDDLWDAEGIPAEAVEISEPQWYEFIENQGRRQWVAGEVVAYTPPEPPLVVPRAVAMWRARTIMKVTPWGEGTLFDAVQAAIPNLEDPLQRATAEEALDRGDVFDRDGVLVPMLAGIVGVSDEQLDDLIIRAAELPA